MLVKEPLFLGTQNALKKHDKGCVAEYTARLVENIHLCLNLEIFMLKLCRKFVFKGTSFLI